MYNFNWAFAILKKKKKAEDIYDHLPDPKQSPHWMEDIGAGDLQAPVIL